MKKLILLSMLIAILNPAIAGADLIDIRFSIDPASPSVNGNITPDDVLRPGPAVFTQGKAGLGLQDNFFAGLFDNLDALSYGQDPIINPLFFSVDRVAVGKERSDVNRLAKPGIADAARHVYMTLPPVGTNTQFIDGTALGLKEGFFGDDLNGLSFISGPVTYFSIDSLSASVGTVVIPGEPGVRPSDILRSTGNGSVDIFKRAESIGLDPSDEIDALVFDGSRALFSLSPFSPSTFIFTGNPYVPCVSGSLSPADICVTDFEGSFSLWASADAIGLLPDDNVDALATRVDAIDVPEPSSLILLASGLILLGVFFGSDLINHRLHRLVLALGTVADLGRRADDRSMRLTPYRSPARAIFLVTPALAILFLRQVGRTRARSRKGEEARPEPFLHSSSARGRA